MEDTNPITLGISLLGLVGGGLSYVLNLKINHNILLNNQKIEDSINDLKDDLMKEINSVREDSQKDILSLKDRNIERSERLEREVTELKSGLGDRILTTVNGKYIRTDLYNQAMSSLQDRTSTLQRILEMNLTKIEEGLNRQIIDLKERIFHKNG